MHIHEWAEYIQCCRTVLDIFNATPGANTIYSGVDLFFNVSHNLRYRQLSWSEEFNILEPPVVYY